MKNPEEKNPIKTKHTHTKIPPKPQKNPKPTNIRTIMQKTTG